MAYLIRDQKKNEMIAGEEGPLSMEAHLKLDKFLKQIVEGTPRKVFSKNEIVKTDIRIGHIDGKPVKRLVIHLRSNGCAWKKSGGCTMCGFWNETSQQRDTVKADDFISQFQGALGTLNLSQYPILSIYNAGSAFNEEEIPFGALESMFRTISEIPTMRQIILESRIEYVTKDKVRQLKNIINGKDLIIGAGLESSNDTIRELCIHKGLPKKRFEQYIEMSKSLGMNSRIYVLIKPPFLTEGEAIEDVVGTTKYLCDLGVRDIHYETTTIEDNTLVRVLFNKRLYQLPWLWSIVEIINRVSSFANPFLSPFRYIVDARGVAHNCALCDDKVTRALLEDYSSSFDLSGIKSLDCSCKSRWLEAIAEPADYPLEERVLKILSGLSQEDIKSRN